MFLNFVHFYLISPTHALLKERFRTAYTVRNVSNAARYHIHHIVSNLYNPQAPQVGQNVD